MILVKNARIEQSGNTRIARCSVSGFENADELVFKATMGQPFETALVLMDWVAVTMLVPAMVKGMPLVIDGPVTPTLLYNLNNDIQALLRSQDPSLVHIVVTARDIDMTTIAPGAEVATGFSAGVDTFTTLALYDGDEVPKELRVTSLTTFNVGAMGPTGDTSALFERYWDRVTEYAGKNDMNWQVLSSNMSDFYVTETSQFIRTHALRNISAAFFFQDVFRRYLYSSTYSYAQINTQVHDISYVEPMLLPLLSTDNIQFISAGASHARLSKMEIISTYEPAKQMLDVCVEPVEIRMNAKVNNCAKCWKCSRAAVNLDILGRLDDFSEVFDLEYYYANKQTLIKRLIERSLTGPSADVDVARLLGKQSNGPEIARLRRAVLAKIFLRDRVLKKLLRIPLFETVYRKLRKR